MSMWPCRAWPRGGRMKVEGQRSYRSVWVQWNFPDVTNSGLRKSDKNLTLVCTQTSHTCTTACWAWPLLLHFERRSLLRRGGSGSRRTRMTGGRVFTVLPEQMSQQDRSERCTAGASKELLHAQHTPECLITACTMHSGCPVSLVVEQHE